MARAAADDKAAHRHALLLSPDPPSRRLRRTRRNAFGSRTGQMLGHLQKVPAVAARVGDLVHQIPDEMDPEPADRTLLDRQAQIWRRRLQRIERPAVVLDLDLDAIGTAAQPHRDLAAHARPITVL